MSDYGMKGIENNLEDMKEVISKTLYGNPTVKKVCEFLGLDEDGSWDYALPQQWVDDFKQVTKHDPRGTFVWMYDDQAGAFGRPRPLTPDASAALIKYNAATSSRYAVDGKLFDPKTNSLY